MDDLFLIVLFLVLAILFILTAPVLLLTTSIYYAYKHQAKYRNLKGTLQDFWLNEEQKEEYKMWCDIGINAFEIVEEAKENAEKNNLSRNLDGRLSARSELGKKLQKDIEENVSIMNKANGHIKYLERVPIKNWNKFYNSYKAFFSLRLSAAVYFISVPIVCQFSEFKLSIQNALLFGYNSFLGLREDSIGKYVSKENGNGILIISGLAILAYYIGKSISYQYATKISPEPPKIDYENFDLF